MTILEAIQKSTDFLGKKGVDSPRLQSELLLAHILQTPRLKLYLDFGRNLSDEQTSTLRELVQRRGTREPLQHILGTAAFCGFDILVNRNVLVPRPETELLAEEGWKFLNSLGRRSAFLDFGTGSGCIAIALGRFATEANGWALDRCGEALAIARQNASKNGIADRLKFVESDGFSRIEPALCFDLIISNPPYIPSSEISSLQEEVRNFDPRGALDGGPEGLAFYHLLAKEAGAFLNTDGKLMVEFGDHQEKALVPIFESNGWRVERVMNDYSERPRILIAQRR